MMSDYESTTVLVQSDQAYQFDPIIWPIFQNLRSQNQFVWNFGLGMILVAVNERKWHLYNVLSYILLFCRRVYYITFTVFTPLKQKPQMNKLIVYFTIATCYELHDVVYSSFS